MCMGLEGVGLSMYVFMTPRGIISRKEYFTGPCGILNALNAQKRGFCYDEMRLCGNRECNILVNDHSTKDNLVEIC